MVCDYIRHEAAPSLLIASAMPRHPASTPTFSRADRPRQPDDELMSESLEVQTSSGRRWRIDTAPPTWHPVSGVRHDLQPTQDRQDAVVNLLNDNTIDVMIVMAAIQQQYLQSRTICADVCRHSISPIRLPRIGGPYPSPAGRGSGRSEDARLAAGERSYCRRAHIGRLDTR